MKGLWSRKWLCVVLCLVCSCVFVLGACGEEEKVEIPPSVIGGNGDDDNNGGNTNDDNSNDDNSNENNGDVTEKPFTVNYLSGYVPQYFDGESVDYEITKLADGVHMVANTVTLSGDRVATIYAIEVDLNKADINAGTTNNAVWDYSCVKAAPYVQAQAWESATGGQVYASVNADFFGSTTVNAFVKNGVILKNAHNDNGNYDYLNSSSDVPASAPMLFGINGTTAQIAPIVSYEGDITSASVKQSVIQAKLSYQAVLNGGAVAVAENAQPASDSVALNTTLSCKISTGIALKLDVSNGLGAVKVLEKSTVMTATQFTPVKGEYAYLITTMDNLSAYGYFSKVNQGDTVQINVTSPDGAWDGYTTILGCRQALIIDGEIASTVKLENTNGAQTKGIPRTAVGIKQDGTVVVFAVEALRYYGLSTSDSDSYGLNLPELAEFMYFYGCVQGANFDGGGSTQLVVRGEGEAAGRVYVRCADNASSDVDTSRAVMNSLLVTSKKEG